MTQMASLLAVATVFVGLWTLISTFYGRLIYIRELETKTSYVGT
jgi:hypothetical protein